MNLEQVKELMAEMNRQGIAELTWKEGGVRLSLSRGVGSGGLPVSVAAEPVVEAETAGEAVGAEGAAADQPEGEAEAAGGELLKSPVVGVFYAASSPDRDPFVQVGQTVQKGDVLCIIEAMKLMNEVVCEKSGVVTEILVSDGEKVEYGQALLRIK